MAIKNYTTSVDSYKTISEIQQILARAGAQQISINNDKSGNPVSLAFMLLWGTQAVAFALPCNFSGVKRAMSNSKKVSIAKCTDEQALRVGWRIIKDWVAAQMAIVEAEACTMTQVFLPYAVTNNGDTVYKMFEGRKELLTLGQ